jgi:predicted PurR-regulated permease PerM
MTPTRVTDTPATRALVYASVAAFVVVPSLLLWYALSYVLLLFFGILLALLLRAPANWLAARTPLSEMPALALVAVVLLGALGVAGYFFGHAITAQTLELGERLPQVVQSIQERMREHEWGRRLHDMWTGGEQVSGSEVLGGAMKFAGSALEVISHVAILIFFSAFLALQPDVYRKGVLHLVPKRNRERAAEVMQGIGEVLQRWLVGQAILMLVIGVLAYIGLTLLGAPLALPLALLVGLLNFIPYVGPIVSAIPAVLVGFSESTELAGYIALLFVVIQSIEGYILEPLIQNKAVFLPPALILFSQVLLTLVGGPLGTMVATPLAAAVLVAVKMLYVEDTLGERID